MDISDTLAPNSDQLDAVDLIGKPRTFTITGVSRGNDEQPVDIKLAEFPRVWRPGKSMRRVLAACWGTDASQYIGRKVRLYCDENVRFGNDVVGGTRISHLSHIDKAKSVPLLVSRGRAATFTVQPLPDEAPKPPNSLDRQIVELVKAFDTLGVTVDQLETKLGNRNDWTAADVDTLKGIGKAIKAGETTVAQAFGGDQ